MIGGMRYEEILAKEQANSSFEVLASVYSIPDESGTRSFLTHHRDIASLLFGALPNIKTYFGESARAEVRLIEDMEDNLKRLRVTVTSKSKDASDALDKFDEEWWLDNIQFSKGLLSFSLKAE